MITNAPGPAASSRAPLGTAAPHFGADVEESVLAVLRSGHVAQGRKVAEFEAQCAQMAGTEFAVAVANGTLALETALEVLDAAAGDEVITSPFTFAATLNAILRSGATARFADIDTDFVMDARAVNTLINERTRVLMPVHLYGLLADMDQLAALATEHALAIIEDASQAHGARQGERRAGGTGLGCFSFYATKNVTSAEGGMITTSDGRLAAQLRVLRNQGMLTPYQYVSIGRNLRMTDVAAAMAVPQMKRLDEINATRNRNAALLSDAITSKGVDVTLPQVPPGRTHVWHQYTVLLARKVNRQAVVENMVGRGVSPGVYYPRLVWDHDCYRQHPGVARDETPVATDVAARCLSLPVHPGITEGDIDRITDVLASSLL
jgi:perosamine synthetase